MKLPPLAPNAWLRWDVVQRLLPPEARSVLEIGCGQGGFGARLSVDHDYLGVEPDLRSWQTASARVAAVGRGEVRRGRADDVVEPGRQFDLVCAFEVLEHIEDDAAALAGWVRWVRPGGWVLLSTPAFQSRFGPSDQMAGHFRRYEPDQMRAVLEAAGLVDVEVVVYGGPLGVVLEVARNAIGRRRMRDAAGSDGTVDAETMQELTSGSGRLFQPAGAVGVLTRVGTAPFRAAQRRRPGSGVCLVARARRPDDAGDLGGGPTSA